MVIKMADLDIRAETRGEEHLNTIIKALEKAKFKVSLFSGGVL